MSSLQGGKFGNGFLSAGVAQATSGAIDKVDVENMGVSAGRVVAAAVVGGTTSALTGGNFANGAVTAAFGRAFNDEAHPWNVANASTRVTLAAKALGNVLPWLESQSFATPAEAAAAFSSATQDITSKYGVELGANINPYKGNVFALRDFSVGGIGGGTMEAARGIVRVNVLSDPAAVAFIHDHPFDDTFSTADQNMANFRNIGAYVSTPSYEVDYYTSSKGITTVVDPKSWISR